jgi:hypothetical protein
MKSAANVTKKAVDAQKEKKGFAGEKIWAWKFSWEMGENGAFVG